MSIQTEWVVRAVEVSSLTGGAVLLSVRSAVQEFRQKVMLGTPFVVVWLVGFIADLDIDSWLIKSVMYAGVWVAVQFLSKYVPLGT